MRKSSRQWVILAALLLAGCTFDPQAGWTPASGQEIEFVKTYAYREPAGAVEFLPYLRVEIPAGTRFALAATSGTSKRWCGNAIDPLSGNVPRPFCMMTDGSQTSSAMTYFQGDNALHSSGITPDYWVLR